MQCRVLLVITDHLTDNEGASAVELVVLLVVAGSGQICAQCTQLWVLHNFPIGYSNLVQEHGLGSG